MSKHLRRLSAFIVQSHLRHSLTARSSLQENVCDFPVVLFGVRNSRKHRQTPTLVNYIPLGHDTAVGIFDGSKNVSHASSLKSPLHGLWEPNDLKFEPDIPEFKELHIRMKGYDYPILESYAKYVHKAVKVMFNLESDAWPSPAKSVQIRTYHPGSTSVNQKYELHEYVRTVAAENVPSTTVPLLLQLIQKNCPQGIQVALKEPDPEEEEFRYVPDYEVLELKAQMEALASGKVTKK